MLDQSGVRVIDYDVPEIVASGPLFVGKIDGLVLATLTSMRVAITSNPSVGGDKTSAVAHVVARIVMTPSVAMSFAKAIEQQAAKVERADPPRPQAHQRQRPRRADA